MIRRQYMFFTLIELLVVISIISLLIAVLLPALSQARKTARNVQCLNQQRQMAVVYHSYLADNRQNIPADGNWASNVGTYPKTIGPWQKQLGCYMGTTDSGGMYQILICPEMRGKLTSLYYHSSYGVNYFRAFKPLWLAWPLPDPVFDNIQKQSEIVMLVDYIPNYRYVIPNMLSIFNDGGVIAAATYVPKDIYRHASENANGVYLDGHAQIFPKPVSAGSWNKPWS